MSANRHVLVTGGARGIGAATARLAGRAGWRVTVNYRKDAAAARAVVAEIEAAGGAAAAVPGDVSVEDDVVALFDAAEAAHGPLHAVVVNAGIVGPAGPLAGMDAARLRRMVDVNLYGALLTAREAARRMPATGGGAIVFLSSVAARLGAPGQFVDYAATKGALDTLTVGLARELGPQRIRVNAVRPGLIDTDIHGDAGQPDRVAKSGADAPLGRAGSAEEVAETVLFLLSDAAAFVSGALLDVTGGR